MATINDIYLKVKTINLEKTAMEVVNMYRDTIVDINKDQLQEGNRKDGAKIKEGYKSESYADFKFKMNKRAGFGNVDLKKTGAFYDGFKLKVLGKGEFDIYSTDWKSEMLRAKYGGQTSIDIFGLNPKGREMLISDGFQGTLVSMLKKQIEV